MNNTLITDARARIEKVVSEYRSDETRTNYKWVVKKEHCYPKEMCLYYFILALVCVAFVILEVSILPLLVFKLIIVSALCFFSYLLVARIFKPFKEKVWQYDLVSEADILYLCGNSGLKDIVKDAIKKDHRLTYTSLVERADMYLYEMQREYNKKMQNALLEKIEKL